MASLPPLLPKVDAILVLDGDGNRLAGKYYGDFLKGTKEPRGTSKGGNSSNNNNSNSKSKEDLRTNFEKQLQQKIVGIAARSDAAEVVTVMGKTAVFCGGGNNQGGGAHCDVRIVHVGPPNESELVLAHLCEGMYDALAKLMGGSTDRTMVLDNLELVFLLIDEHCDGGIVLETDGNKLAAAVLLRDDDGGMEHEQAATMAQQGLPTGVNAGDMTIAQALRQAREQWLSGTGM